MKTGLTFNVLANFVLIVTFFEVVVDLLNIFAAVHTPFQKKRYITFVMLSFALTFICILNILQTVNFFRMPRLSRAPAADAQRSRR